MQGGFERQRDGIKDWRNYRRPVTSFYLTVSPETRCQHFTLPARVKHGAPFTAQNITVREWKWHGASFTAQNITLRSCKTLGTIGYRDDDQTITLIDSAAPDRNKRL
ncbi:hypothetical protein CDAR_236181, partial [Caerostris darwini]